MTPNAQSVFAPCFGYLCCRCFWFCDCCAGLVDVVVFVVGVVAAVAFVVAAVCVVEWLLALQNHTTVAFSECKIIPRSHF